VLHWFVRLYRNTLFRLTLLTAFLFVSGSLVSLSYIYYATISADLNRMDDALTTELQEFVDLYEADGLEAVDREIILRTASGEGLYLLQFGPLLSGNLNVDRSAGGDNPFQIGEIARGYIPGTDTELTKFEFTLTRSTDESGEPIPESDFVQRRARGLATPLLLNGEAAGSVVVARDVEVTMRNGERIRTAILYSAFIALGLGLLSAYFVSQRFSRRIEAFNRLATNASRVRRRVSGERNYSEDELDQLAENLNEMLDHIDRLMRAMRYAGDSIAHDLRSPLTRLRTRLETAAQNAVQRKDENASLVLSEAADDAQTLLQTFDSVLRIARLEADDRREMLLPLDPAPLLEDIAELYEPAFEDAGLTFTTDIAQGTSIRSDRGLLSQAVSNLVENAIKYTPEGGAVTLGLRRMNSGKTELYIADNGPGIPEPMRERVKERFVRLEESRSAPGSGLGLALVDAVAEVHRAEFKLSDGLGDELEGETPGLRAAILFPRVRGRANSRVGGRAKRASANL
jgi:signal transduction histidine kinase